MALSRAAAAEGGLARFSGLTSTNCDDIRLSIGNSNDVRSRGRVMVN